MASIERIKLAQEIHDGIAQDLVGVGYSLDLLLGAPDTSPLIRTELRTVRFAVTELIDKVRREMYELREPLGSTLAQELHSLIQKYSSSIEITTDIDPQELRIPREYEYEIARIAGELLQNIVRHSGATCASLTFIQSGASLDLYVSDNGDAEKSSEINTLGLAGVRERAENIYANFEIEITTSGTHAHLSIPLPDSASK
ncbi:MAG: histidine kinase [Actinomycetes bacterium]